MTFDWGKVADTMRGWAEKPALGWKFGQEDGLRWLADRIATTRGLLIADEVGLGKTRLAVAAMHAVTLAGGRVLVVAPASLLHQWDDERSLFLEALGAPDPRPATAEGRHLRHFNDLFKAGCAYPLSKQHPFILASHGFGIPQKIGASTKPYTWALPFIVRSFAQHGIENWGGAKGLKTEASRDERLDLQRRAAAWLAQRCKGLETSMEALPPLNMDAGAAFSTGGREKELRQLLQTLVGRLMGPFDLIVIDEAHKSREELVEGAAPYKRLSNLLEETVVSAPGARRLAMTATPVQLAAEDWGMTLQRIGLKGDDLGRRLHAIKRFEEICDRHGAGPATDTDVDDLCRAAKAFEEALRDVVVRRRWSDQVIMERARAVFGDDGAHPHRRWTDKVLPWAKLTDPDRMAFLAAEGRAQSSRGTALALVERSMASRHAQAMDEIDALDASDVVDDADGPAVGAPEPDTTRHAYWKALQARYASEGSGILARHPRIAEACTWIEGKTDAGEGKVLVFANYTKPLVALSKALNVRRFLREVAAGKPALPPHAVNGDDVHDHPLLRACLASMPDDDRERIEEAGELASLIRTSEAEYRATSDRLAKEIEQTLPATLGTSQRIVIRLAALEWMLDAKPAPEELEARIAGLSRDLAAAPMEGDEGGTGSQLARLAETLDTEQGYSTLSRSEFARELYGNGTAARKHVLQSLFNTSSVRPQVLVAQTRVAAEGLNLHRACRHVLFLHLDWNPATIEQQIGRVDRVGSLWSNCFEEADGAPEPPRIELATIVIEGTSDAERKERILARQRTLGAHLFGELLAPEVMRGLSPEWRARLNAASPSFSPRAS
jgi:hypothetical protein